MSLFHPIRDRCVYYPSDPYCQEKARLYSSCLAGNNADCYIYQELETKDQIIGAMYDIASFYPLVLLPILVAFLFPVILIGIGGLVERHAPRELKDVGKALKEEGNIILSKLKES